MFKNPKRYRQYHSQFIICMMENSMREEWVSTFSIDWVSLWSYTMARGMPMMPISITSFVQITERWSSIPSSLTIISSGFVCRLFNNRKTQEKNSIWNANKESHSQESTMSVTLNTSDLRLLLSRTPPNFHLYLLNDSYSAILGIHWLWILKNRKWAKTKCVCIWHKINRQCCRRRCCCCCCCRTYRSTYIRVCMAWVRKRPNQLDFFTFQFFLWRKTLSFTFMERERERERGRGELVRMNYTATKCLWIVENRHWKPSRGTNGHHDK